MAKIDTELLYSKEYREDAINLGKPESFPYYPATAFGATSFKEIKEAYKTGYTYIRTNNPDRDVLAGMINRLEAPDGNAATYVFSSGMAAIAATAAALLKSGDHVICHRCAYGETLEVWTDLFEKFGVECSFVDMDDAENVRAAVKPNTAMIYTETLSNPTINAVDLKALSEIAKESGAYFAVDGTFTTAFSIRPLEYGADIVINSLTKFLSGHSDIILGSATGKPELIEKLRAMAMIMGSPADPFPAFQMIRALETFPLRIARQMSNAAALARFFEDDPHIVRVNHPAAKSYAQKDLAEKFWKDPEKITGMMSVELCTEDEDKIDAFMKALKFVHYAPTLGGMKTSLSHPVTSSHNTMEDSKRRAIGITPALMRISVGIEDPEDLIEDFRQALKCLE